VIEEKTIVDTVSEINTIEMINESQPLAKVQQNQMPSVTPSELLRFAIDKGADLDRLERLMELDERYQANQARKAYHNDMAKFKLNPPTIYKDKQVSFPTQKGLTGYKHASIGNVGEKIVAALAEHGFSHRWVPSNTGNGMYKITCVITHKLGHSESTELEAPADQTGGKNTIQAMISTNSYLERHSLLMATGLSTKDQPDDDGREGGGKPKDEPKPEPEPKETLSQKGFLMAEESVKKGEWSKADIVAKYKLTTDQEIALDDAEREFKSRVK
jgi:hypothetical protein